jgi:hypothetical protein
MSRNGTANAKIVCVVQEKDRERKVITAKIVMNQKVEDAMTTKTMNEVESVLVLGLMRELLETTIAKESPAIGQGVIRVMMSLITGMITSKDAVQRDEAMKIYDQERGRYFKLLASLMTSALVRKVLTTMIGKTEKSVKKEKLPIN